MNKLALQIITAILLPLNFAIAERPTLIGVSVPLTGGSAEYGEAVQNAIELAQRERPELFTRTKFIIEDNRYDSKTAVSVFTKFRTEDKVDLVYTWGVEPALAIAPLAERYHIPLIATSPNPSTSDGRKYVIRFINPSEDYSKVLLEHFRKSGIRKIEIIKSEFSFYDALVQGLHKHAQDDEEVNVSNTVLPSERDFRSIITRLKGRDSGALGIYLGADQITPFFKHASELRFSPAHVFGATPFESKTVLNEVGGMMEGAVFPHNVVDPKFHKRYMDAFKNDTHISYAANAYEFSVLSGELFNRPSSSRDADGVISAFSSISDRKGALGRYGVRVSSKGGKYFEFEVELKTIRNGAVVSAKSAA